MNATKSVEMEPDGRRLPGAPLQWNPNTGRNALGADQRASHTTKSGEKQSVNYSKPWSRGTRVFFSRTQ